MSDSRHVYLNDKWYRIAEDAEGDGYHIRREPLRIPNAQVVQGTEQFQLRPDLLQWSITDWSEGEGQLKFDPQQPGRSQRLVNVDPFSQPGNLMLGLDQGVVSGSTANLALSKGPGGYIYGVLMSSSLAATYHRFDPATLAWSSWGTPAGNGTSRAGVVGDNQYLFFVDQATDNVYRVNASGTTTLLNDQTGVTSYTPCLVELGAYLYLYNPDEGSIFEISKATINTTTAETALYADIASSGGSDPVSNGALGYLAVGDNRVYVMQTQGPDTIIHEIVPTSAYASGYGRELGRYPGIVGHGLVWFGGMLLMLAQTEGRSGERFEAFYIDPDGALGTLGEVRSHVGEAFLSSEIWPGKSTLRYVSFIGPNWDTTGGAFFLVDTVSGGFTQIGTLANASDVGQTEEIEGIWLIPLSSGVNYLRPDRYAGSGYTSTPFHDFDLADEKVLREITVTCEPLPTDTSIVVKYDLGDGTLTTAGTLSTADSEGATFVVSTDTSTKTFRHVRVHLGLSTTDDTVSPVVRSVEVRASVVKYVNVWELLLDLSDDHPQYGRSGAGDAESLLALAENTVYAFKDAYRSHVEGSDTEYDVELDSLDLSFSQPGEGVAHVILRET